MQKIYRVYCVCVALCLVPAHGTCQQRPVTAADCVTVRHFLQDDFRSSIRLNAQGTAVAYLVQAPNLETNENDVTLEIQSLSNEGTSPRRLITGSNMSGLNWIDDGRAVSVLIRHHGRIVVARIDVTSGQLTVLAHAMHDITEYSISADGKQIVFATQAAQPEGEPMEPHALDYGYRIPFQRKQVSTFLKRQLFFTHSSDRKHWSAPTELVLTSPWGQSSLKEFAYALSLRLSLSPDGRSLAFTYMENADQVPDEWKKSSVVQTILSNVGVVEVAVVVDLKTHKTSLPLQTPWTWSLPFWSSDSRSFLMAAISPVNSVWESQDREQHLAASDGVHLFAVNTETGGVKQVLSNLKGIYDLPLAWNEQGGLLLHTGQDLVSRFRLREGEWNKVAEIHLPLEHTFPNAQLASNGDMIVGDYEAPAVPPQLFAYRDSDQAVRVLARLNPQFDGLTLASIKEIHWQTSTGYDARGLLFIPPGYQAGKRYPLVIDAYFSGSNFFCDSGLNHDPSFAPQPIANAGMMFLIRTTAAGNRHEEESHYPQNVPAGIREAAFQTDLWDSAVEMLAREGVVDPHNVGIIGFSRSGWYAEYALAHGHTHFAAATVADNVEYSLSEYWLGHTDGMLKSWEAMYGGPPAGQSLQHWVDYSISFNLDKIHTPLLMEVMGYGQRYSNSDSPPLNLATHWDVLTGLARFGDPVELYYYPFETHQPEHPRARFASLERNVAWYAFWLLGKEVPDPRDPGRYDRWSQFRKSQQDRGGAPH
jgi:dipeptidyl aminopeptidase/acylaminoacyl peptidase